VIAYVSAWLAEVGWNAPHGLAAKSHCHFTSFKTRPPSIQRNTAVHFTICFESYSKRLACLQGCTWKCTVRVLFLWCAPPRLCSLIFESQKYSNSQWQASSSLEQFDHAHRCRIHIAPYFTTSTTAKQQPYTTVHCECNSMDRDVPAPTNPQRYQRQQQQQQQHETGSSPQQGVAQQSKPSCKQCHLSSQRYADVPGSQGT